MTRARMLGLATALLLASTTHVSMHARAEGLPASSAPTPSAFHLEVKRARLDNGLRVVVAPDHTSPTVAIDVVYDVGGRSEERGRTGLAHLFEHMMFQGSRNVPRGEHVRLVTLHGGQLDGITGDDVTSYHEVLPSSELSLGLWLEADRMRALDVTQANLDNQRSVVREEYRKVFENRPYVPALLRANALVYQGYFPYEHDAPSSLRDLETAPLAAVRAFHDAYYGPNNAVLVIAGDVDEASALDLVKRWFADIPARPDVPRFVPPPVPEQTAPRAAIVEDVRAKLPAIALGWMIPPASEADHHALELAAAILGDGDSARLPRQLVRDKGLAIRAEASVRGRRGPDLFEVFVTLASGAKVDAATRLVDAAIADLARNGPTDEELKRARSRARARFLLGLQTNLERARVLATLELDRGDAASVDGELGKLLAVTKDDVRRVTARYLTNARRSLVEAKPGDAK